MILGVQAASQKKSPWLQTQWRTCRTVYVEHTDHNADGKVGATASPYFPGCNNGSDNGKDKNRSRNSIPVVPLYKKCIEHFRTPDLFQFDKSIQVGCGHLVFQVIVLTKVNRPEIIAHLFLGRLHYCFGNIMEVSFYHVVQHPFFPAVSQLKFMARRLYCIWLLEKRATENCCPPG